MKISIITPTFNSDKYLERAIDSVINQNYDNWEHLIIDGASTDQTLSILKNYPHLKWVSEKDKGQSDAMNKGLSICTGDVIVFLNSDDEFEPNVFKSVIDTFVSGKTDVVIGNGKTVFKDSEKEWFPTISLTKLALYYKHDWPFNPVAYFCKKKIFKEIKFNVNNHYSMDYEFLLDVYSKFRISKIPLFLGRFYMYEDNKSATIDTNVCLEETLRNFCSKNNKLLFYYYLLTRKKDHYFYRIKQVLKID